MIEVHNNQKIYEYLFVLMDKLPETNIGIRCTELSGNSNSLHNKSK